jgi:hypothetical protein
VLKRTAIAEKLAVHPTREARATCASFPWISQSLMLKLSTDKHSLVRQVIARNPNAPKEILQTLLGDVAPHVRTSAHWNLNRSSDEKFAATDSSGSKIFEPYIPLGLDSTVIESIHLAHNKKLSDQEVERLIDSPNEWVRAYLMFPYFSFGPKLPEPDSLRINKDQLNRLANDASGLVRSAVARNPLVPETYLIELAKDREFRVRSMICQNKSTPEKILDAYFQGDEWRLWAEMVANPRLTI